MDGGGGVVLKALQLQQPIGKARFRFGAVIDPSTGEIPFLESGKPEFRALPR